MTRYNARDGATSAAICGFAAAAWFGWAQQGPPAGWSIPLAAASIASLVIVVGCGLLIYRRRHGQTAMSEPRVRRLYQVTVAVEAAACLLGAVGLTRAGLQAYIPAWILFVVGVHFVPLARLFGSQTLMFSGLVLIVVAAVAVAVGAAGNALPSAVAGAGGGLVLAVCALLDLRRAYLAPVDRRS